MSQEGRSQVTGKDKSRQHCSPEHLAQPKGFPRPAWEEGEGARGCEAPGSPLAAHDLGHLLPLLVPGTGTGTCRHLSAMASGNDGDLQRAHGHRGSNGHSQAQELISGKRVLGCSGEEALQPILFFFPPVFL